MRSSSASARRSADSGIRGASYAPTPGTDQCSSSSSRRASRPPSRSVRNASSATLLDWARRRWRWRRVRSTTRPTAAPEPTTAAAAGRPSRAQFLGSPSVESSHDSSSSAASSTSEPSVFSSRSWSSSGGSTGASAWRSMVSMSIARSLLMSSGRSFGLLDQLLELLDGSVHQHLGRTVGAAERPRDLAVVHPQREAHDQRLAAIVRQVLDTVQDALEVVAVLDERLRRVRGRDCGGVVYRRLRLARAVAVVVGGEVVRDPDQPRPQRPPLRLALGALEVAVRLQEGLLREVLGVVVVPHPVVRVGVDVAQVRLVERREVGVEARLGRGRGILRCRGHAWESTRRGPSAGAWAPGGAPSATPSTPQLRLRPR